MRGVWAVRRTVLTELLLHHIVTVAHFVNNNLAACC